MLDCQKYAKLVNDFENLMMRNQNIAEVKLGPDKWTLKEIVGHLIDSASNNHQRFMRLQIDERISLPGYDAEAWVGLSNVQNLDYGFVVAFWEMYNQFLVNLIESIAPVHMQNRWETEDGKAYALGFLIEDYFDHMKLHFQMFIDRQREIERSKGV